MPKGIMGNGGSWSLIAPSGVSATAGIYAFSFLVGKHREPQSINAKLFLPIIPIGIVEYPHNLCRNSCISILAWVRSFPIKIANFPCFFCPSILKRDLDTKKTTPNEEVSPESLRAMLEC